MKSKPREKYGECPLCGRECWLTFHHLIPLKMHRRTFFKKNFTKQELHDGIDICRECHDGIHDRFDEITLGKEFPTLDALKNHDELKRHYAWAAKQKVRSIRDR